MENMTSIYDIAEAFGEETARSIFITGKAGTGKTTFLRNLRAHTHKQMVVVAPTGVAAINAEGVTIHSFFQLPLSPFIPTPENKKNLISKIKLRNEKRRILRQIEVLVIDEISMVRADILDEVDTVLRFVRHRKAEPFGGVQVILIGDLYQLPPVTLSEDWAILQPFYKTPYFFDSCVIRENPPIYIELDKIFRQNEADFIQLLNEVRNNQLSEQGFELLQSRYHPDFDLSKHQDHILLTTHNAKANSVNQKELDRLHTKAYTFKAIIHGNFPERNFPNEMNLTLKKGAKVMFIANDMEFPRRYYNGKMGIISQISDGEVNVKLEDGEEISVNHEIWRNVQYHVNQENGKIEEEEMGTYIQYPLRLAWAITIHKSQGLTFDKVIIDAEDAFTSGQVYVALSRCRSLSGIVLNTPIYKECLCVEQPIIDFSQNKCPDEVLANELNIARNEFKIKILSTIFDFQREIVLATDFNQFIQQLNEDINEAGREHALQIIEKISELHRIGSKFIPQQQHLLITNDLPLLKKRLRAAKRYFSKELKAILSMLANTPAAIYTRDGAKEYKEHLKSLYIEITYRKKLIQGMVMTLEDYYHIRDKFRIPSFTLHSVLFSTSTEKIPSGQISYDLYKKVKNVERVATERGLSTETIYHHLMPYIAKGDLPLSDFVEKEWQDAIWEMLDLPGIKTSDIFDSLEGNVSYTQIRLVKACKAANNK